MTFILLERLASSQDTIVEEYALEYGSAKVEIHIDAIQEGWNIVIHDDLLATEENYSKYF